MSLVIFSEDALRTGQQVNVVSKLLYAACTETFDIGIMTNDKDAEKVNQWLSINGFDQHTYLMLTVDTDPESGPARRVAQVNRFRRTDSDIKFVVESDLESARALFADGVPTIIPLHPKYSRPDFRPDYEHRVTPWSDLVHEVDRLTELKNSDSRVEVLS
jgi:hypothetical protein